MSGVEKLIEELRMSLEGLETWPDETVITESHRLSLGITRGLVALQDEKEKLEKELAEARAEIERMTPKFVAYEYLEAPDAKLEKLEKENEALRAESVRRVAKIETVGLVFEAGRQLANVAYNIGQLGHVINDSSLNSLRSAQVAFDEAHRAVQALSTSTPSGGDHG